MAVNFNVDIGSSEMRLVLLTHWKDGWMDQVPTYHMRKHIKQTVNEYKRIAASNRIPINIIWRSNKILLNVLMITIWTLY